jgi:hypothetical protein
MPGERVEIQTPAMQILTHKSHHSAFNMSKPLMQTGGRTTCMRNSSGQHQLQALVAISLHPY